LAFVPELDPLSSKLSLSLRERVRVREAATLVDSSLTPALSHRERGMLAMWIELIKTPEQYL